MLTDLNFLRGITTVLAFTCFIGIVLWAWSSRNRTRFEEAASLPLHEDELDVSRTKEGSA